MSTIYEANQNRKRQYNKCGRASILVELLIRKTILKTKKAADAIKKAAEIRPKNKPI
jgi:hypothetical protein